VLGDTPRGYWRLGETSGMVAAAAAGNNPGQYLGGVTLGAVGALTADADKAAGFDGNDDRVSIGDPADGSLDFGTSDFTLEAWIKTTVHGERTVVSKRASSGAYWQFTVTDDSGRVGHIRVNGSDGAANRQAYGPAIRVDDGQWHHVVVAFDRDVGITVYVDGVSKATAGSMAGNVNNAGPLLIGKATSYAYFLGQIDEVALYPRVLPAARVQAHNSVGRGS
jgi:hypothetical protein